MWELRITADLQELGWRVSENTVAAVVAEQHLVARAKAMSPRYEGKPTVPVPFVVQRLSVHFAAV